MKISQNKKKHAKIKSKLHAKNKHNGRYKLDELVVSCPQLAPFVITNQYNDESIDFFDPFAVKMLNKALLFHYYNITSWDIPKGYLCPPIPGRADYIHHIADMLGKCNKNKIPQGNNINCLDIGVGANCVYPIIANHEYGWHVVGSELDPKALDVASSIVSNNDSIKDEVEIRQQMKANDTFVSIIKEDEKFDITICNPPFHASLAEANASAMRKLNNLGAEKTDTPVLNFGGKNTELWCFGGEEKFVKDLIVQSATFANSCLWFSTLISKQINVDPAIKVLKSLFATDIKTIPMGQGNKISRILAWTFQTKEEQESWMNERWM
jgi:23S rRNA (adenine1618-N6)-methyltransferase